MDKDRVIDLGLDVAKWAEEQAQSKIDRIDHEVKNAHARSEAVSSRTQGTGYEAFGRERKRIGEELLNNPPNKAAQVLKVGALIASGVLLLYKNLQR